MALPPPSSPQVADTHATTVAATKQSHKFVSELCLAPLCSWRAGDVLRPHAHARPARECPDAQPNAQLAMQNPLLSAHARLRWHLSKTTRYASPLPPRYPPMRLIAAQPGHAKLPAQVEAAATEAQRPVNVCTTAYAHQTSNLQAPAGPRTFPENPRGPPKRLIHISYRSSATMASLFAHDVPLLHCVSAPTWAAGGAALGASRPLRWMITPVWLPAGAASALSTACLAVSHGASYPPVRGRGPPGALIRSVAAWGYVYGCLWHPVCCAAAVAVWSTPPSRCACGRLACQALSCGGP